MKREIFYTMEYKELEALVKKAYNINYSYLLDTSADNDTLQEHWAEKPKTKYSLSCFEKRWQEFLSGSQGYRDMWYIDAVLYRLCIDGYIPTGKYLIRVSW